jgi:hypothetical protein
VEEMGCIPSTEKKKVRHYFKKGSKLAAHPSELREAGRRKSL